LLFVLLLLLFEWCGWCVVFVGGVVVGGITPPTTNNTTNNNTSTNTNNQHQHPQAFVTILAQDTISDFVALARRLL
jgi:hypothetical protein